jgi:hypothetical protein
VADQATGKPQPRVPTRQDLVRIARSLNDHGVRYAIIGGMAMIHHGFARGTVDIDLLVDPAAENVERIRQALAILEDRASLDVRPSDLADYTVVRVADEVVVDLLAAACGVSFDEVAGECEVEEIDGVAVRFLNAAALLRTKQSIRDKDAVDRRFLEEALKD